MWFGVNPLRWKKPTAVSPRERRGKKNRALRERHTADSGNKVSQVQAPSHAPEVLKQDETTAAPETATSTTESNPVVDEVNQPNYPGPNSTRTLYGHSAGVYTLLTSDDRYIISGSMDTTVRVWSRGSFNCYHVLKGHRDVVCALSINTTYLLSASHDTTIGVWMCLDDFRLKRRLEGHRGHVTSVALLSSLRDMAVSCSEDGTLRVWQCNIGLCLFVLTGHRGPVSCFLVTPTFGLWSGSADTTVCVWGLSTTATPLVSSFKLHRKTIQSLILVKELIVASASNDGRVLMYDAVALQVLCQIEPCGSIGIYTLVTTCTNSIIGSTGDGRLVCLDKEKRKELRIHTSWIPFAQRNGNYLACISENFVFVVDLNQWEIVGRFETCHGLIHCISWLNASTILTCGADGLIQCASFDL